MLTTLVQIRIRLGILVRHPCRYYKKHIKCLNGEKSSPSLENIDLGKQPMIRIKLFLVPAGNRSSTHEVNQKYPPVLGYGIK